MQKKFAAMIGVAIFLAAGGLYYFFFAVETPKILSEDRLNTIFGMQETKGFLIGYKNTTHRIDLLVFENKDGLDNFMTSTDNVGIANFTKESIGVGEFNGYAIQVPVNTIDETAEASYITMRVLWNDNSIVFCGAHTGPEYNKDVCEWFVKEKTKDYA